MRKLIFAIFACTAVLGTVACSSDKASMGAATPATAAIAPAPLSEKVTPDFQASGPLVVENQVDVAAQRDGVVAKLAVEVGSRVKKGQVLAVLDDRQITADRDAAKAKVDGMAADYEHWVADLKLRQSDFSRSEEMWKAKLITEKQLDHDRYAVESGRYYLERQAKDLDNSKAALTSANLELEKTRIAAPFDGVVARRYVRVGQKVALNDRLFWVTATEPLNVRFTLPQELAGKVKPGDKVRLAAPFDLKEKHEAKITLVSPVIDPASGTFELQAQVLGAVGELRPGMTVNISVQPR